MIAIVDPIRMGAPWEEAPALIQLPPGHVHVWRAWTDREASCLPGLHAILTQDERAGAARHRFARDRTRAIVAHAALRSLLAAYLDRRPEEIVVELGPFGKPRLAAHQSGVRFNLSHSHDLALMAFSRDSEVGVDVERAQPIDLEELVAAGFLSEGEVFSLRRLDGSLRQEALLRCWTRKEAYLKAIGQGMRGSLGAIEVCVDRGEPALLQAPGGESEIRRWRLIDLDPAPDFAACVAIEGEAELSCRTWTPQWLGVRS